MLGDGSNKFKRWLPQSHHIRVWANLVPVRATKLNLTPCSKSIIFPLSSWLKREVWKVLFYWKAFEYASKSQKRREVMQLVSKYPRTQQLKERSYAITRFSRRFAWSAAILPDWVCVIKGICVICMLPSSTPERHLRTASLRVFASFACSLCILSKLASICPDLRSRYSSTPKRNRSFFLDWTHRDSRETSQRDSLRWIKRGRDNLQVQTSWLPDARIASREVFFN